jgi:hypothetical protein
MPTTPENVEGKKANRVGEDVTPESTPMPTTPENNQVSEDVIPESTPVPTMIEMDEFDMTPFPTTTPLPEENNLWIPEFEIEDTIPTPSSSYMPMMDHGQTIFYQKKMIENQNHRYHTTQSDSDYSLGIYSLGFIIIAGFSIFAMYRKRLQYQTIPDKNEKELDEKYVDFV